MVSSDEDSSCGSVARPRRSDSHELTEDEMPLSSRRPRKSLYAVIFNRRRGALLKDGGTVRAEHALQGGRGARGGVHPLWQGKMRGRHPLGIF